MNRRDVDLMDCIAPPYYEVHNALLREQYREYWLSGGRASLKSSVISIEIILGILRCPDANAAILRRRTNTLRKSVWAQILWAINKLGVAEQFKANISNYEIEYIRTGQKIYFFGADDPEKIKSVKLEKGYFKYLWFEELAEHRCMDDVKSIKASFFRGETIDPVTFYSYNPPKSANNWVNAEGEKKVKRRYRLHTCYLQMPAKWVGKAIIEEAEATRQENVRTYRWMYLGEATGTGGAVFENVEIRRITDEEISRMAYFYNGGDFGWSVDPDVLIRCAYNRKTKVLYIIGEVYGPGHSIAMLADKCKQLCGHEYIRFDYQEGRTIGELKQHGVRALEVKKGPGSVENGIHWLQGLSKIVIDKERCPNAAREFRGYEHKRDKNDNFIAAYPDAENHTIDAVRYAMQEIIAERRGKVA